MTNEATSMEPADSMADASLSAPEPAVDIVSVNKKGAADNRLAKAVFILVVCAMLIGALAWFSQDWLNSRKAQLKASSGPKATADASQVFNPEKTGADAAKPKLGADSGVPPPSTAAGSAPIRPGAPRDDGIRPVRGADGKVMVNAQGRAMGVDKDGNVVEVPPIAALSSDPPARKPLPGGPASGQGQGPGQSGGQAQQRPASRFAGSLFVGDPTKPLTPSDGTGADPSGASGSRNTAQQTQAQQIAEILRSAGLGGTQTTRAGIGQPGGQIAPPVPSAEPSRPGTVGSALHSSATPVSTARRLADQNLILPKGRQADCVLTTRIVDEVAGFTSCVLAQNLYSDNGRVLLLERGSELTGEYGVTNQLGLERLFVTWTRIKTPLGVEIDLSSPGSDRLGTSGLPGHLDNRWGARIGAALLLSFVKDITVAIINKQTNADIGATVNVQATPGQNSLNASSSLAEEVIKQTIKVRPRLTINEGDRISIYVARDLDFSPVYGLTAVGAAGATKSPVR